MLALALPVFVVLFAAFGVSVPDAALFLGGLLVLAAPGAALVRLLRLDASGLDRAVLAAALGLTSAVLVNKFTRLAGLEPLFFVWLAAGLAWEVRGRIRDRRRPARPESSRAKGRRPIALAVLGAAVLAALAVDNFRNARLQPDGALRVNLHYYDGFIRNATIREVAHSVPPQMPFAAGAAYGYHYGMDLFISLFDRYLGLGVPDLVHRLTLAAFFLFLLAAAYAFGRELAGSEKAAGLMAALVVFGSGGLTYAAGLLLGTPLGGNVFRSFYFFDLAGINSLLPALGLLFSGWLCLARALKTGAPGWAAAAAILLASTLEFKIFLFAPVVGSLLLAGGIARLKHGERVLLRTALTTAALSAVLLAPALFSGRGAMAYRFRIVFMDWFLEALKEIRIERWTLAWNNVFHGGGAGAADLLLCLLFFAVFVLGTLGLSLLALPAFLRGAWPARRGAELRLVLAFFVALSAGAFFGFGIFLGGVPRQILNIYNYYAALAVLLLALGERAAALGDRPGRIAGAVPALVLALSLPTTIWFLGIKAASPEPRVFDAGFLAAAKWLETTTPAEAVVLQPLDLRYACYFSGRRSVLDDSVHSYLTFHLPRRLVGERRNDVNRFFRDPENNADVLGLYGVALVWTRAGEGILGKIREEMPLLLAAPAAGAAWSLSPVYRAGEYVLLGVARISAPSDPGASGPKRAARP